MHIQASGRYLGAINALADLFTRQRVDFLFVGSVARSAWLGTSVDEGSLDVLALVKPEQKDPIAMMASNRGFLVEREEVQAAEELDLIPMHYAHSEGDVRVHILIATNALYGRMFPRAAVATAGEREVRVVAAEDLALLLSIAGDEASARERQRLETLPEFDRAGFRERLIAVGLGELAGREA